VNPGRSQGSNLTIPVVPALDTSMNPSSTSAKLLKRSALLAFLLGLLAFAGCQTMEGPGKDIQDAGKGIEKAAK
jgi:predicted small secreted protein